MYELGDKIQMKKSHPCGGNVWEVSRVGVEIKLRCITCGKYQNLSRDDVKKRTKAVIKKDGQHEE